jgi:hypothetical protein
MRKLYPASPQRLQRLLDGLPTLTRALFFVFFLLLRAVNSFRAVGYTPSLTASVFSFYTYFLLCDFCRVAALLAA